MESDIEIAKYLSLSKRNIRSLIRFVRFIAKNYPLMAYIKIKHMRDNYIKGRVTVITPTYKRLEKLVEAIQSVQRQTYTNWEHIVVSDGYDGKVKNLICSINDARLSYYYTYRMEVMGNYQRNYALKYATGEFIIYLDDDNIIYDNCLSSMVGQFTSDNIGYVIGPILYGNNIMSPKYPFRWGKIDLLNYMVRRKLVEKLWGQNVHMSADFYLIDRISKVSMGNYVDNIIGHHR